MKKVKAAAAFVVTLALEPQFRKFEVRVARLALAAVVTYLGVKTGQKVA